MGYIERRFMPRISVSGPHGVGKSTLIAALKNTPKIEKRFTFKDGIIRSVTKNRIRTNEYGLDNTQLLVMAKFLEHSTIPNTILDKCSLDGLVYTAYLYENNQVKKSTLQVAESIFENVRYDIYFYIAPESAILATETPSNTMEIRNRISELFEEYIQAYKLPIIRLSGKLSERVSQFVETIDMYDKWVKAERKEHEKYMRSIDWSKEKISIKV